MSFRSIVLWIACFHITLISSSKNGFCNLVWSDEFSGSDLDTSKWQREVTCYGGGNDEAQCYTARPKNVFIDDGKLVLKVYKETYTGTQAGCTDTQGCTNTKQFTSGRVRSALSPTGSFLRGRMEIRAKLCSGNSLWPAIWMLPTDWSYGGWAASGEIDIMEQRGNHPNMCSGTLHHGGAWPNNKWTTTGDKTFAFDLSDDYHVYGVEWTESKMVWFVDDQVTQSLDMNQWWNSTQNNNPYTARGQPWDKKFHFVLNVAVGGPQTGFFNGYPPLTDADYAQWKVSEMRVDYVRAYSLGGDCSQTSTPTPTSSPTSTPTSNPTSSPISSPTSRPNPTFVEISESGEDDVNNNVSNNDMDSIAKTTIIVAATVGGAVFLLGIAAILAAVLFLRKAQRKLDVAPVINTPIHNY